MGKPALLASRTTTPALEPNHKKPPITAIHAERPTPGSKLPSATKREQALALEKPCGTITLLECAKLCFRFGEASLLASRAITPALEPNQEKPALQPSPVLQPQRLFRYLCAFSVMADPSSPTPNDEPEDSPPIVWPHSPPHRATPGVMMVTAGTLHKENIFTDGRRLSMLQRALLEIAAKHGWQLEAWCVFPNHYHFVAHPLDVASQLSAMLKELHSRTARAVNRVDHKSGRKVWHNYWDTPLTHDTSYYARLHYVHSNAVKHRITASAAQYPYCSASWFERTAPVSIVKTIYRFKIDQLKVDDDF